MLKNITLWATILCFFLPIPPSQTTRTITEWQKLHVRAHPRLTDRTQAYNTALIAPLSPITLLISKPRLIWLLPRSIWCHLPGRAAIAPSIHLFSKLLILFRVTEGKWTHTHAVYTRRHMYINTIIPSIEPLFCLGVKCNPDLVTNLIRTLKTLNTTDTYNLLWLGA